LSNAYKTLSVFTGILGHYLDGVSVEEYEADLEKEPQGFSDKVEVKEVYATTSQTGLHTEK
jgi:hypothetical protein